MRRAEAMACLAVATDLALGQPIESAMRSCVMATELARELGYSDADLADTYYYALLRFVGCNAETTVMADAFGDEIAFRRHVVGADFTRPTNVLRAVSAASRDANDGEGSLAVMRATARGMLKGRGTLWTFAAHCEVAQLLAERMGFGAQLVAALGQLYERWDGKGLPNALAGEQLSLPLRVVAPVQDALAVLERDGREAVTDMLAERAGTAYDPRAASALGRRFDELLARADGVEGGAWEALLACEPVASCNEPDVLDEHGLETALTAMADFVDVKLPFTLGRSREVAQLAEAIARRAGLGADDQLLTRHAGYVHDLGRCAVSAAVWMQPRALREREWEQVRLHPYHTGRILARSAALARVGAVAELHHERLDGSGYARGCGARELAPAARALGVADATQAMLNDRPHRSALQVGEVARQLREAAAAGALDADMVEAAAAEIGAAPVRDAGRKGGPATGRATALTPRERDVLVLIARGHPTKRVAVDLGIAHKTADRHIQNIYAKLGVSTRAAAALHAVEAGLLATGGAHTE
jgi:HD-GYP domain-containing protein (c-di-GMP phosphodiesterase class II)